MDIWETGRLSGKRHLSFFSFFFSLFRLCFLIPPTLLAVPHPHPSTSQPPSSWNLSLGLKTGLDPDTLEFGEVGWDSF